jgi:uncharacterized protein YjcR
LVAEDIVAVLRRMEQRQGEDYIWRTAKVAADEIERLRRMLMVERGNAAYEKKVRRWTTWEA